MCNDFRLKAGLEYLIETFSQTRLPLRFAQGRPNVEPRDDIRITDRALIARPDGEGARMEMMRWSWPSPRGAPVFNFRSEGRRFATESRCLILADGFYEFTGTRSPKDKWLFTLEGSDVFAIAGLVRHGAARGEDAFTMLTCEPGPDIAPYHDRQVVVLPPDRWAGWLTRTEAESELLRPLPAGSLNVEKV